MKLRGLVTPTALVLLGLALVAGAVRARTAEETLDLAIDAYTRALHTEHRDPRLEEFRRAQRLFASLSDQGVRSPALFTNLGNAALQAEDLGAALLAYRRALLLDADHPRALQNLEHARTLLPPWIPRPESAGVLDSLFFWHRTVPAPLRTLLAAVCFAIAALGVAASIRFEQAALRNAAILPGLAWALIVGAAALDAGAGAEDAGVVTREAVARAADSALSPSAFPQPLPPGVELRILEQRDPWLRVRLANGRDAWLPAFNVRRVAFDSGPEAG